MVVALENRRSVEGAAVAGSESGVIRLIAFCWLEGVNRSGL